MLQGKKILLGVTGSIAAYKTAHLTRLLVKAGAEVQVISTTSASEFIAPLTLATLSKKPVLTEYVANSSTGVWNNHVELGLWADLFLVAPASANTVAKMANGICDNLLLAIYLSARCPVVYAPAMDLDMYQHFTTQNNFSVLAKNGVLQIPAGTGELASGLKGQGRMAEPEEILTFIDSFFKQSALLKGKKIVVTAGPTYEPIDPVRFIGNHSSGKMGIALAQAAANQGADVVLVCGPTEIKTPPTLKRINVKSAQELFEATKSAFESADCLIMSAAVADYTPATVANQKIKKKVDALTVELKPTIDVLSTLSLAKRENQVVVGFALETENEFEHALGKLKRKQLDAIVLNSLNDSGAGFGTDTNKVQLIFNENNVVDFPLLSKTELAQQLIEKLVPLVHEKTSL